MYIKNKFTGNVILSIQTTFRAKLVGADLSWADLRGCDLRWAVISGADLRGADLRGAKLVGADLRGADLRGADLRGCNLVSADLRGSDLSECDLSGADLSGARLDDKIYSISRVGSDYRMTTFNATKNIVWCGCFTGTIEKFEIEIKETHHNNEIHLHNYLSVVNYFKSLK